LLAACTSPEPVALRLLTYNIGHPEGQDPHYAHRLKERSYEECVRDRLREQAADVVFLQEVLAPERCDGFVESDPAFTCYESAKRQPPVRRLLGPDYTIVCDSRRHVECIGVRTSFGAVSGIALGDLVLDGAETPPLPLEACEWALGRCSDARCDAESTVSAVTVTTRRGPLRLVHVHPMAPGRSERGVFWGGPCRYRQLQQVFEGLPGSGDVPLVAAGTSLVVGDFNLDPVRMAFESEAALWQRHVGEGRRFRDLTPSAQDGTQFGTRRASLGIATDHVLAERATGACTVHGHGLGLDPGTEPLDAGCEGMRPPGMEGDAGRIDHFAISCDLTLDLGGDKNESRGE
jgi:endonuclease/exonuclease/phosphatase family metal-dependent hydrolase